MKTPLPQRRRLLTLCALLLCMMCSVVSNAQLVDVRFKSPVVKKNASYHFLKEQPDGKILVSGTMTELGATPAPGLVRLNPDGTIDPLFRANGLWDAIIGIEFLRGGDMLAYSSNYIFKLNRSGKLLNYIYLGNIASVLVLPDNSFIVSGFRYLYKYNASLQQDPKFNNNGNFANHWIYDVELQGNKLIIGGRFSSVLGVEKYDVVRLNSNGTLDNTFDAGTGTSTTFRSVTVQPDGKILLGGNTYISDFNGSEINGLARLNANGSVDEDFWPDNEFDQVSQVFFRDGKIYVTDYDRVRRFFEDGSYDDTYYTGYFGSNAKVAFLKTGQAIAYNVDTYDVDSQHGLLKLDVDGNQLEGFDPAFTAPGSISRITTAGSKIYIAGDFTKVNNHFTLQVALLNADGSVDTGFTSDESWANNLLVFQGLPDGNLLLSNWYNYLFKITSNGSIDWDFHANQQSYPRVYAHNLKLYDENTFVYSNVWGVGKTNISNGTSDGSYEHGYITSYNTWEGDVDIEYSTGKVVAGAYYHGINGQDVNKIVRFNTNGSIDNTFNVGGPGPNSYILDVVTLHNGEIFAKGWFSYWNDVYTPNSWVKLKNDGSLDETFQQNIGSSGIWSLDFPTAFRNKLIGVTYYNGYTIKAFDYDGKMSRTSVMPRSVTTYNITAMTAVDNHTIYAAGLFSVKGVRGVPTMVKINFSPMDLPRRIVQPEEEGPSAARANTHDDDTSFKVYPNPSSDFISIESKAPGTVGIYTMDGQMKINRQFNGADDMIDVRNLKPGRYVIKIKTNGRVKTEHFVIK